jgi:hypothetical protein
VRLFPCDIVKRQSGGAIFYKHEAGPVPLCYPSVGRTEGI